MALPTDVSLPRSHSARFPDRCVVCHRDEPTSQTRIITGTLGWWTWLLWWFGKPFLVKVPTCPVCGWRLHASRLLSLLVSIGILVAAYYWIWPSFKDLVPHGLRRPVQIAIVLVCLLPQIVF